MAKPKDERDALVDEELEESFPASDPPSSNAGERVGRPWRQSQDEPNTVKSPRRKKR